jgi:hypothetical protein
LETTDAVKVQSIVCEALQWATAQSLATLETAIAKAVAEEVATAAAAPGAMEECVKRALVYTWFLLAGVPNDTPDPSLIQRSSKGCSGNPLKRLVFTKRTV